MKVAILLCFVFLLATCDYAEDIKALHSRIQKENKGLAYEILA